ncbi:Hypothetical predicted protein [Cloeon dipterum]|uniref:Serpin domain-containing protein n=1 Tax=Cloeon dipterum TaxID=197152 RepID=A0A8S1DSF0_9INSE|nr:Hypothetical predicted protein [Cloeon dipterum]
MCAGGATRLEGRVRFSSNHQVARRKAEATVKTRSSTSTHPRKQRPEINTNSWAARQERHLSADLRRIYNELGYLNTFKVFKEMAGFTVKEALVIGECHILDRARKPTLELLCLKNLLSKYKALRVSPPEIRLNVLFELKTIKCNNPNGDEDVLEMAIFPTYIMAATEIIGPHLDLVDLTGLISFCHPKNKFDYFQEVLQKIFRVAHETISKVLLFKHLDLDLLFHCKINFCNLIHHTILFKMPRLRELRIELFACQLDDLMDLIYCCRSSLVFVSVNLDLNDFVLPLASELQEKLASLRIFLFRSESKAGVEQLNQFCVRNLPKLQVVQEFASEFCTGEGLPLPDPEERPPAPSNLLHLTVNLDTILPDEEEIHLRFPHITHLKVFQNDEFFPEEVDLKTIDCLLNFSMVEHLDFRLSRPSTFNRILEKFLGTYKYMIKTLSVVSLSPTVKTCNISHIFRQCPNLEKLNFVSYEMEVDWFQPPINHLRELELLVTHITNDRSDLLSFILRPPTLERVKLIGQTENVDDVKNVIRSIRNVDGILRNLKSLVIDMDCPSIGQVKQATFESYVELITCAEKFLKDENLENIKFFMNKLDEYSTLVSSSFKLDIRLKSLIRGILFFLRVREIRVQLNCNVISFLQLIAPAAMDTPFEAVSKGNSEFSRQFYRVVAEAEPGNIVSSPLSCLIALAMAHAGAKGDSIPIIAEGLRLPENMTHALEGLSEVVTQFRRAEKVELSLANKIYVKQDFPILEEFSMALAKYFQVKAENVVFTDPSTADKINKWVSEQTKNKIKNLVDSNFFDDQTRLVLVNATYFKGSWLKPFKTHKTRDRPFFTDENSSVPVPMMFQQREFTYRKLDELDAQLLILPYQGNDMSMAIILPNKKNGLKELEENLANSNLGKLLQSASPLEVTVYLPKFKIETSLDLVDHLTKMGLRHIFSDDVNLTGISTTDDLKVSNVVQKAFIEVSEEGTEAAAATAMCCVRLCSTNFLKDLPTSYKPCLQLAFMTCVIANLMKCSVAFTRPNYNVSFLLLITPPAMDTPFEVVCEGNSEFSREFYRVVAEAESGNFVSSPMSCLIALAMAHAGAKGDSVPIIAKGLRLPENMTQALEGLSEVVKQLRRVEKVQLSFANKIYVKKDFPILKEYSMTLKKYFQVEAENVVFTDPSTADKVNKWVSKQTKYKITNLVDSKFFFDLTWLVLVNAIYFKGQWLKPFSKLSTKNKPFFTDENKYFQVPIMYQETEFPYRKLDELDAQLLIMPYHGDYMSMAIILPNKKNGLKTLEEKLATTNLNRLLQSARLRKVTVFLPKFKIETSLDLVDQLSKMGISHIFSTDVNLTGISTAANLRVSDVVQKAFIEVSEEGTEVADATAVRHRAVSGFIEPEQIPIVNCDHPFVFYVNFKSTYVFGGRVANPANN